MKPTQLTELFANIRANFVSFFSILMFAALGVGIFVGISWVRPAMETAADTAYDQGGFHNFQVQFPYGLTQDDIGKLAELDGVDDVEAGRYSFQNLAWGDSSFTAKVQSLTQRIDVPDVVEGALPAKAGEVALEATWAKAHDVAVGATISFAHDAGTQEDSAMGEDGDADGMSYLTGDTFRVSGLVESVEYLATSSDSFGFSNIGSGSVDVIAWVSPKSFDAQAYHDGFTFVDVACASLDPLNTFSGEYGDASAVLQQRIEQLGTGLAKARYQDLHSQAQEQVEKGEEQIGEARAQVADGQKQVDDGERQLSDAKDRLVAAEQQLLEAYPQLQDAQAQLDAAKETFQKKLGELKSAQDALEKVDLAKTEVAALSTVVAQEDNERQAASQRSQKRQQAAQAAYDAKCAELDEQLEKGQISQEEHDAAVAQALDDRTAECDAADAEYDAAVEAGNARIDAACSAAAQRFKDATGVDLSSIIGGAIDHGNVGAMIAQARAALADDAEYELAGKKISIAAVRKKVEEGQAEVERRRPQLEQAESQLAAKWEEYYSGQAQAEEGRSQIASGEEQLTEAKAQLKDGKKQLAEGEKKLQDAKWQLGEMREFSWTVLPRAYNGGVQYLSLFGDIVGNLSYSMAALFVIVGLLVSYSAVSRIVHEQITQIGTKKALGLRRREITASFLVYSCIAVAAGAVVGIAMGVAVVETIILRALEPRFILGAFPPYFEPVLAVVATAVYLALVLAATWFACRSILKQQAVELLKGEKPPEGRTRFYEKWGAWERLPLFTQTVVNNCMNDKRRVFSTIVGVAGCTALIVCAITLNDDVLASFDKHYADVYGFDAIAYVEASDDWGSDGAFAASSGDAEPNDVGVEAAGEPASPIGKTAAVLADAGCVSAPVYCRTVTVKLPDGAQTAATLNVPADEDAFEELYHVVSASGGQADLSAGGVWVCDAVATHRGLSVGDTVQVSGTDGSVHDLPVAGFFEYYLTSNEMVCGRAFYEQEFGGALAPNALLVDTGGFDVPALESGLRSIDGFTALSADKEGNYRNFASFSSVSRTVVLVYLALASLMALVVLLNLNVMFINEKKRDLIVLMINGFSVKDAKRYIYNDTIVLTLLGIALGVVLGCVMGALTVAAIEPATATFVKDVAWRAVAVGVVGTAVLALVMSLVALRRIPAFNLTDINKL